MAGLLIYHGCKGHNTIYRDLTYSGQGVRGVKKQIVRGSI